MYSLFNHNFPFHSHNFLFIYTEHLINSLGEFDITYPTELDHRGQVTDHVTTLTSHRRRRRSLTEEAGPIIYQVLQCFRENGWVY